MLGCEPVDLKWGMIMRLLDRRTVLLAVPAATLAPVSGVLVSTALAVDALPDARFVGFCQAVNDFDIASGQLALARSANENVRGYATRSIAEATDEASRKVGQRIQQFSGNAASRVRNFFTGGKRNRDDDDDRSPSDDSKDR